MTTMRCTDKEWTRIWESESIQPELSFEYKPVTASGVALLVHSAMLNRDRKGDPWK